MFSVFVVVLLGCPKSPSMPAPVPTEADVSVESEAPSAESESAEVRRGREIFEFQTLPGPRAEVLSVMENIARSTNPRRIRK
mgnify:CR=1 FL=1